MDAREHIQWVLRRIGPPPSDCEITQVAELKRGRTVFGRGAGVDFYIDSKVLKNFISRRHAIIVGETGEDNQLQFTLYNQGLNGTYVNDVRIGNEHRLREGDRVTFGHKNGVKVKVGELALQPDSEFQYKLERMVTPRQGVLPLGERLCQAASKGVKCLSEYDRSECHFYSPAKGSQSPMKDLHQDGNLLSLGKFKAKHLAEVASRMLLISAQSPQSRHSEAAVHGNSEAAFTTKVRTSTETKHPAGSTSVAPFTETKQSVTSASKSPSHCTPGSDNPKTPLHRYSSDSVPNFLASEGKNDVKLSATGGSLFTSTSLTSGNNAGSSRILRDRSRSPISKPESSESLRSVKHRSRSPRSSSPKPNDGLSKSPRPARHRSRSPMPAQARSMSPKSVQTRSRSPSPHPNSRSRSMSPAPGQLPEVAKSKDDANKEDGTLLAGYDEPPVLTPESIVRTPSPSCNVIMECDEGDDFEEIESDRESIGWEVPPTPGHSLGAASPHPHATSHSRRTVVSPSAVHQNTTSKAINRRVNSDGDETDFGGERHTGYSDLEKSDLESERSDKEHVSSLKTTDSSETKRTGLSSVFSELKRSVTSSSTNKESLDLKPKAKLKGRDSVDSDSDDVLDSASSSTHSSDRPSKGKRRRSSGSGSESRHKLLKKSHHNLNVHDEAHVPVLEKENGFSEGRPSGKHIPSSVRSKERSVTNGTQLKDVRVSVERVSAESYSRYKHRPDSPATKHRSHDVTSGREKTESGKDRPSSRESRMGPASVKTDKKSSVLEEPLSGPDKDKTQKTVQSKARPPSQDKGRVEISKDKTRTRKEKDGIDFSGDWLMKEIDRTNKNSLKPQSKSQSKEKSLPKVGEKSKECSQEKVESEKKRERLSSGESLESQDSRQGTQFDLLSSGDERENPRQVRKIAMRRPRVLKDSDNKKETLKEMPKSGASENKPNRKRDGKRRRRRKKKVEDDDDDDDDVFDDEGHDEMLEDGVTWYEEECCDSDLCSRPRNRRVEWVQCDDCDKWYHTVCVGCNLEEVKDEDFHCGCV